MGFNEEWLDEALSNNPLLKIKQNTKGKPISRREENGKKTVNKSKYGNKRTKIDGILFDSTKEANTYAQLKNDLQNGLIAGFCRQAEFILNEGNEEVNPIRYKSDWVVFKNDGTYEIWDDKGMKTDVFKLKERMFKVRFPKLELKLR